MPKNTDNVSTPCGLIETPNDRPSFHSRMVSHVACIVDTHLVGDRSAVCRMGCAVMRAMRS